MQKRNAMYRAAPALDFFAANDVLRFPVAALHQHIGLASEDEIERCVFIEFHYQADRFQRSQNRHAISLGVDRAVIAFALAFYRCIAVHADNQRCAECPRLGKVSDVAAMQNIEAAIGKYQRAWQFCKLRGEIAGRAEFFFKAGQGVHKV